MVRIILDVAIRDEKLLMNYAKQRHKGCWEDNGWEPRNIAEAVYEALIASNESPSPAEYGIEILTSSLEIV